MKLSLTIFCLFLTTGCFFAQLNADGLYKGSGKHSHFINNRVYGIPKPDQLFFETGIFMGLGI